MENKRHYETRIAQLRAEAAAETRRAARNELLLTAATMETRMRRLFG